MSSNPIVPVQAGDPEMESAMQTARDRFSDFWSVLSADYRRVIPVYAGAMAKAYFCDSDAPQSGEHMWVRQIDFDGKMISAVLADRPRQIRGIRTGEPVSFPVGRLSDWFYVEDGQVVGAFTVRLLRTRMTDEQRQEHDSHYPFRFD
jgi:uncharacterized protein YegJ (DUF2314 family)